MVHRALVALAVLACVILVTCAGEAQNQAKTKDDLAALAKLMPRLKELRRQTQSFEEALDYFLGGPAAKEKRQAAWDGMDYGWGGGRFGKRAQGSKQKKYDAYNVGGRFGKRSEKRYDAYNVGGRFGRDTSRVNKEH